MGRKIRIKKEKNDTQRLKTDERTYRQKERVEKKTKGRKAPTRLGHFQKTERRK